MFLDGRTVYDESQIDMKFLVLVKFNFADDAPVG